MPQLRQQYGLFVGQVSVEITKNRINGHRYISDDAHWYFSSSLFPFKDLLNLDGSEVKTIGDRTLTLRIDGEVDRPGELTYAELVAFDEKYQIVDIHQIDPRWRGDAIKLAGLLLYVGVAKTADYLGLHSSHDDFHASIPLETVLDRAFLIYRIDGQPLPLKRGGPIRFAIPDFAACHTDEIDECANVKFVDHIELTVGKGFDNRPEDDQEHEALHRK